jgi:hypothetical protein
MPVIIPQESGRPATIEKPTSAYATSAYMDGWKILGWLGLAYLIMSVIDLALGWYPLNFGRPEWEFGTISASFSGLAIPTLALYLMLGSALARERTDIAKGIAIVMIILALSLAILALLYLTSVPLALKAVAANPVVHLGMKKSVFKTLMLFTGYEALYVLGAIKGLRKRAAI